jgi:hypothetical protein
MASYIGRSPEYGNAVSQQITGTNSAGPYTLSYDTSTSGVVISLDGVVQRNSVDFNIVGTALTFTSTVGTGIIINVVFTGLTLSFPTPSDGSVTDAKITAMAASKLTGALPAISGASLTALNATNLGSGTVPTARLGSGTASSSTFLRGDQTYAEAGGGAWTLIGSQVASSDASLTQTGLSSTYNSYACVVSDLDVTNNASILYVRLGDSSGIDSAAGNYKYTSTYQLSNGAGISHAYSDSADHMQAALYLGNAAGRGGHAVFYIGNHTTNYPHIHGTYSCINNSGYDASGVFAGHRTAVITVDRVQILMSAGSLTSCRFTVYGIKHT